MESMSSRYAAKEFLARIIVARVIGQSEDEFAAQEMRRLRCPWCREGWPPNAQGQHELLGVVMQCDANDDEPG